MPHATVGGLLTWQYYDLSGALPPTGDNAFEVRLAVRNPDFERPRSICRLVLSDVELEDRFLWPSADWSAPKPGEAPVR